MFRLSNSAVLFLGIHFSTCQISFPSPFFIFLPQCLCVDVYRCCRPYFLTFLVHRYFNMFSLFTVVMAVIVYDYSAVIAFHAILQ